MPILLVHLTIVLEKDPSLCADDPLADRGRRPGEGLGIRTTTARPTARLAAARPGPEFQDFDSFPERPARGAGLSLMAERRAPQRALPLRCGPFLVLREDRAPAETTRREPCRPGEFCQGNGPQRDPFFGTAPTGAPEKVRSEMTLVRIKPSLPPF
jgi:hypothetical protein